MWSYIETAIDIFIAFIVDTAKKEFRWILKTKG